MCVALLQLMRSSKSSRLPRAERARRTRADIQFSSRNPANLPGRDELCENRALIQLRVPTCSEVN